MRAWDFETDGPIALNGEWEFYWDALLTSEDFRGKPPSTERQLIPVPGSWNRHVSNGAAIGADGRATYRLRVLWNPQAAPERLLAIRMPNPVNTAHILYVDGAVVGSAGRIGTDAASTTPQYVPYLAPFAPVVPGEAEIILQVANYHHARGGVIEALVLGNRSHILAQQERNFGVILFLSGSIFIMGIYHLGLFGLRRREPGALYFGLFCLNIVAVVLNFHQPPFFAQYINPSWPLFLRVGLLMASASLLPLVAFLHTLFPEESAPGAVGGVVGGAVVLGMAILFLPIQTVTALVVPIAVYLLLVLGYDLRLVWRAVGRQRFGAKILLAAHLPFLATVLNDGLFFAGWIQTGQLTVVGLFFFVLAQAYLLSARFSRAFTQTEILSEELVQNNAFLHKTQDELRRSEEKYRTVFEDSKDVIFITDREGRVEEVNQAIFDLLGYRRDEVLAMHALDFCLNPADGERFQALMDRTGAVTDFALPMRHRDGSGVACQLTATLRRDAQGEIVGFQGIIHDMTSYRQAEAERERAQTLQQEKATAEAASQAKSRFLATMTHELRTPLNSILGYAQLLQGRNQLSEVQARGVGTILSSGRHLLHLIEDVLDLARIEADRLSIDLGEVDLAGLLADVIDAVQVEAEQKGLLLSGHFAPGLPPRILTDERRLRQILLNLLSNAIRYTEQGEVALRVSPLPGPTAGGQSGLRFAVTDTGVGLTAEEMERIFAPFEQASAPGATSQGIGLGLSISQRLAHLLGSRIQVESVPGQGSRFWFDLAVESQVDGQAQSPAHSPAQSPAQSAATPHPSTSPEGVARPSDELLRPLYQMARLGDMRGVEAEASRLAQTHPAHAAFARQVQRLAQDFADRELCDLTKPRSFSDQ